MSQDVKTVIHLWCCPRTLSTATMYSFAQRPDCKVFDEPLYASHLKKNPELYRPYRNKLLDESECDGAVFLNNLPSHFNEKTKVLVCKHITKQLEGINHTDLFNEQSRHVFLIRDPIDIISSWNDRQAVHREGCTLEGLCFPQMVQLFSEIRGKEKSSNSFSTPIVIDSNILKHHPREVLMILCDKLGIPFYEEQLSWKAGPKPEIDGIWAPYWYKQVHQSTGYNQGLMDDNDTNKYGTHILTPLDSQSLQVYRESLPFFELLKHHAIGHMKICSHTSSPYNIHQTALIHSLNSINTSSSSSSSSVEQQRMSKDKTIDIIKSPFSLNDIRNENVLIWIGDTFYPREQARISVFDSSVQGGDAVWEGLRIYNSKIFKLNEHLDRLLDSAHALSFQNIPTQEFIQTAIFKTLGINGMYDGVHIRLTLTRGVKMTSSMNPNFNILGTTLIVLPEWKPVMGVATYDNEKGITLITASGRRHPSDCLDSKIHHCNLLNNILPKIQANHAGAADAIMLDKDGYVSETNATNLFLVKNHILYTPLADVCLPGITRKTVLEIALSIQLTAIEKRLTLTDFYTADEVFTTGTMGELTKVICIDGRNIGYHNTPHDYNNSDNNNNNILQRSNNTNTNEIMTKNANHHQQQQKEWPVMKRIVASFQLLTANEGISIPMPPCSL